MKKILASAVAAASLIIAAKKPVTTPAIAHTRPFRSAYR
jgi:hypothetical protein